MERYTNGDWDILCIEDLNTFVNPDNLWEGRFPYNYGVHYFKPPYNWPKNFSLETWKYIREKSEKYPKVTDWVDYMKTTIAVNSDGGITNLDHSWVNEHGYSSYLKSCHENIANWCNGKYVSEPLYKAYTNCYPLYDLGGEYGYANVSSDGSSVYLIFTENPRYKKGLKSVNEYLTFDNFPGVVEEAKCINLNIPVAFTQDGKRLSLRVAPLTQDKIATIVKLSLKKPIFVDTERHVLDGGMAPAVAKKGNIAFKKPSKLISNDGLRVLEPSSYSAFAFNGNDGRMETTAAGAWEWNWTYEVDLENVEKFNNVKVYFAKPDVDDKHGFATLFALKVSKDKENWTEIARYENPEGKKFFDIDCKGTEARYVRVDGLKPDDANQFGGQMNIAELEIY